MNEQNAYIMKNILQEPIKTGTAAYADVPGWDLAAKTGTTNDDYDRWLCGFTNKYTMAVWYGYDQVEEVKFRGANPSGQIFSAVMKEIHKDLAKEKFKEPEGIVRANVCKDSGKSPTDLCSRDQRGGRVYSEIFAKGTTPKDKCDVHISVEVCKVSGLLASGNCAPEDKERRVYIKQDATGTEDGKYRAPTGVCTQCKDRNNEKKRKIKEHAESVTNAINSANIGTTNVSDISKLEAIISRYNALTQEEKDAVDGGAKSNIETIKAKITELKKKKEDDDKAKAKTVSDLLATLPATSTMTSANADTIKTSKITPARTKYNELTKDQKDKVTNYNKLTELEEKYKQVKSSTPTPPTPPTPPTTPSP